MAKTKAGYTAKLVDKAAFLRGLLAKGNPKHPLWKAVKVDMAVLNDIAKKAGHAGVSGIPGVIFKGPKEKNAPEEKPEGAEG